MNIPASVEVIEVGMRDGLQMEYQFIDTGTKVELINGLMAAGVRHIEATSFVSPRAVPQLADAAEVLAGAHRPAGSRFAVLAPNLKGVERAIAAKADEIVVFLSCSESHNEKNLNRSIDRSLEDISAIAQRVKDVDIIKKGAIACAFGCPFEGDIDLDTLMRIAGNFHALGFRALTLGDTTGMATPRLVTRTVLALRDAFPEMKLTLHFHNTRGIGLVNVVAGLNAGIDSYESSLGGLGGCPFAPGASGNICTEDLVYLLNEMGIQTGIDLGKLIDVASRMESILGRSLPGQVMKAGPRLRLHGYEDAACAMG
ncbi:hydroxymethylglutaryl-CoA lyase [Pollutimonas subterranea]|uniref:Hydroxymethylglutaryl-CoA lyase n=1 Tax=Pollutimonas subterranea TaxID=2045210 RepID=A0A2N4U237_9BURK|nr:hydroxymethylglutaryl-CoA lyase [Pollutimonas subterranea]PLC49081.1 hydroxymethylglutaryl-CoA lyase [Pollutimonas subterranea]